jgi:hypothetical protein
MDTQFQTQVIEQVIEQLEHLFPIMSLFLVFPLVFSVIRMFYRGMIEQSYSSNEIVKEKINMKKIYIKTRNSFGVKYSFYVRFMKKQGFIKGLFVRFSDEYLKVGKHVYKLDAKEYVFSTSESIFIKIKDTIQHPITTIQDDSMLIQFNEAIHYGLSNLSEFCKMKDIVNLDQEVKKVSDLVHEIKKFSDEISNAAKLETEKLRVSSMNEIIEKHHLVMEQLTTGVKIFNSDSNNKINLKK